MPKRGLNQITYEGECYLSVEAVASILSMQEATIRKHCRDRALASIKRYGSWWISRRAVALEKALEQKIEEYESTLVEIKPITQDDLDQYL